MRVNIYYCKQPLSTIVDNSNNSHWYNVAICANGNHDFEKENSFTLQGKYLCRDWREEFTGNFTTTYLLGKFTLVYKPRSYKVTEVVNTTSQRRKIHTEILCAHPSISRDKTSANSVIYALIRRLNFGKKSFDLKALMKKNGAILFPRRAYFPLK